MHKDDVAAPVLALGPFKREIVKKVAEIGAGGAGGGGGEALLTQVLGKACRGKLRVEAIPPMLEDDARHGQRTARIFPGPDPVVSGALDSETAGAFAQAEMQEHARLVLVEETGA
ncbi:MAG: hypothetical protein WA441_13845 [Methyloceanibacter sp.]